MNTPKVKKPLQSLSINEWLTGSLYGSQKNKSRYVYCLHGEESFASIANTLSGKQITKVEPYCYEKELDWKKLAQFNYGTTEPAEINWYLSNFNGCKKTDSSGNNFIFSSNDSNPFLWIPVSNSVFVGKTGTPLKILIDTSDIISNVFFEDDNGNKIDSVKGKRHVYLDVETRNVIGKKIDIDLSDMNSVFKYNGNTLNDSRICDFEITANKMIILLELLEGGN
jgi:hypothetical protein